VVHFTLALTFTKESDIFRECFSKLYSCESHQETASVVGDYLDNFAYQILDDSVLFCDLNHDLEIIRVLSEFGISFGYTRNNMYFWKNLAIISEKQGLLREALEFWSKSVEVMLFAFEDREVEDLQYHSHVSYLSIDGEIISDSEELLDSYCIPDEFARVFHLFNKCHKEEYLNKYRDYFSHFEEMAGKLFYHMVMEFPAVAVDNESSYKNIISLMKKNTSPYLDAVTQHLNVANYDNGEKSTNLSTLQKLDPTIGIKTEDLDYSNLEFHDKSDIDSDKTVEVDYSAGANGNQRIDISLLLNTGNNSMRSTRDDTYVKYSGNVNYEYSTAEFFYELGT